MGGVIDVVCRSEKEAAVKDGSGETAAVLSSGEYKGSLTCLLSSGEYKCLS